VQYAASRKNRKNLTADLSGEIQMISEFGILDFGLGVVIMLAFQITIKGKSKRENG